MRYRTVMIILLGITIIFSAFAVTGYELSKLNVEPHDIFIPYSEQPLARYQIDEVGVKKVWQTDVTGINSVSTKLTDLNHDGQQEVLALYLNDWVRLFDYKDGSLIWETKIRSITASSPEIIVHDFSGDGYDEIIIKRNTGLKLYNETLLMFDHRGQFLDSFDVLEEGSIAGPDRIRYRDLDKDGSKELILLYGASLYNYTSRIGGFHIQIFDWNQEDGNFTLTYENSGTDFGGLTRINFLDIGDEILIITSGWYNNFIRAFNSTADQIWQIQLIETESVIEMADTGIYTGIDSSGIPHVIAVQNQYFVDRPLHILDIDPHSGTIRHQSSSYNNTRTLVGTLRGDTLAVWAERHIPNGDVRYQIDYYDIKKFELLDRNYIDPQNFGRVLQDGTGIITVPIQSSDIEYPGFLLLDDNNMLHLHTLEGSIRLLDESIELFGQISMNKAITVEGNYSTTFTLNPIALGFVIFLLDIFLLSLLFYFPHHREIMIDRMFQKDLSLQIYLRVKDHYAKVDQVSPTLQITDSTDILSETSFEFIDSYTINVIPSLSESTSENIIKDWYHENQKTLGKLKALDFIILITLLEEHDIVPVVRLREIIGISAVSTFYRRLSHLEQLQLILESTSLDDQRVKCYVLSDYGHSFIQSLFVSLDRIIRG